MSIVQVIFALITGVMMSLLIRNILCGFSSVENYSTHKKRLQQLQFNNKKVSSNEEQTKEMIEKVTTPVIKYILPKFGSMGDTESIEKDLILIGWDKYFSPIQFKALNILMKILGIIALVLFFKFSKILAIIWFVALFFLLNFLFGNAVKEKKEKLLSEFPDFIRISQGYISADMPIAKAFENSAQYVGEAWRPILQEFVVNCEIYSMDRAMDILAQYTNIFEVKKFVSLVKVSMEQGVNLKESFNSQTEQLRDLQLITIAKKISKRQMMCTFLQAPLLLTLLGSFGLPTFASMTNFTSM